MPQFIDILVVITLGFAVLFGWDDGCHCCPYSHFDYTQSVNQGAGFLAISSGTFCNNNSDQHTMRIHGQVYLGVEPPFVRLETFAQ